MPFLIERTGFLSSNTRTSLQNSSAPLSSNVYS